MSVAVLSAALQLCLSSALGHSALFQDLEDQCNVKRSKESYCDKDLGNNGLESRVYTKHVFCIIQSLDGKDAP